MYVCEREQMLKTVKDADKGIYAYDVLIIY